MAAILRPQRWMRQPSGLVVPEVNVSSPFASGLTGVMLPTLPTWSVGDYPYNTSMGYQITPAAGAARVNLYSSQHRNESTPFGVAHHPNTQFPCFLYYPVSGLSKKLPNTGEYTFAAQVFFTADTNTAGGDFAKGIAGLNDDSNRGPEALGIDYGSSAGVATFRAMVTDYPGSLQRRYIDITAGFKVGVPVTIVISASNARQSYGAWVDGVYMGGGSHTGRITWIDSIINGGMVGWQYNVIDRSNTGRLLGAWSWFGVAADDSFAIEFSKEPWGTLRRGASVTRAFALPAGAAPTLSLPGVQDVTGASARPYATLTF